ncbi:hypothetical protein C8J98_102717 [Luteibacter sp. OK325]|uniref:hypothetical protein n=1 Tax=Luteibacter sp. OK325 TaxID=2135670 RepID=UPI000D404963|nr:hypothetical protein [Luteibacter sp. OK325]PTR34528.1 hypothetical protein C8J98_102717 [Luteibacter sp. OK325]
METINRFSRLPLGLAAIISTLSGVFAAPVAAQTAFPNPSGQAQCEANDINDSLGVAGGCVPSNASGSRVATYAAGPASMPRILQALSGGQPCTATGLPNNNTLIGSCENAGGVVLGVIWLTPESTPVTLSPLPALKGALTQLVSDVASSPMAYNQNGAVVGASTSPGGIDTAVLWPPQTGSGASMVVVSSYGDNCEAVDVNGVNVNGYPTIALNCPAGFSSGRAGTRVGKVAVNNALLGGYQLVQLPLPAAGLNCTAGGINDALQIVGTCHFAGTDNPRAAYWTSPTSTPQLLTASGGARNAGRFINASGKIAFSYQKSTGEVESGLWDPVPNVTTYVADLPGGSRCEAVGLGDNNTMALNCENADEQVQPAKWTAAGGTVALGYLSGGEAGALTASNEAGTAASVSGEDSAENEVGGEVGL